MHLKYYEFLASHPVVNGTDENEFFAVNMSDSGLAVTVKSDEKSKTVLYHRLFNSRETKKITLKGLAGNDQFTIAENASSTIKIFLVGGNGDDTYKVQGKVRAKVDDNKKSGKFILAKKS